MADPFADPQFDNPANFLNPVPQTPEWRRGLTDRTSATPPPAPTVQPAQRDLAEAQRGLARAQGLVNSGDEGGATFWKAFDKVASAPINPTGVPGEMTFRDYVHQGNRDMGLPEDASLGVQIGRFASTASGARSGQTVNVGQNVEDYVLGTKSTQTPQPKAPYSGLPEDKQKLVEEVAAANAKGGVASPAAPTAPVYNLPEAPAATGPAGAISLPEWMKGEGSRGVFRAQNLSAGGYDHYAEGIRLGTIPRNPDLDAQLQDYYAELKQVGDTEQGRAYAAERAYALAKGRAGSTPGALGQGPQIGVSGKTNLLGNPNINIPVIYNVGNEKLDARRGPHEAMRIAYLIAQTDTDPVRREQNIAGLKQLWASQQAQAAQQAPAAAGGVAAPAPVAGGALAQQAGGLPERGAAQAAFEEGMTPTQREAQRNRDRLTTIRGYNSRDTRALKNAAEVAARRGEGAMTDLNWREQQARRANAVGVEQAKTEAALNVQGVAADRIADRQDASFYRQQAARDREFAAKSVFVAKNAKARNDMALYLKAVDRMKPTEWENMNADQQKKAAAEVERARKVLVDTGVIQDQPETGGIKATPNSKKK